MKTLGAILAAFFLLIVAVGTVRLLSGPSDAAVDPPIGAPAEAPKDPLYSKYKECDRYLPKSAARTFCEDEAAKKQKQKQWDDYRKTHPRK